MAFAWVDADCENRNQYWLWSPTLAPREAVYNSVVEMTKRGKKKHAKKNSEPPLSEGGDGDNGGSSFPEASAERSKKPFASRRQCSSGPAVDLSFFRASTQLYGELHQRLSCGSAQSYTEAQISLTGRQILQSLDDLAEAADPRSDSKSMCPFLMLLSMLLPTLRKYLTWTQTTRLFWKNSHRSFRHQSVSTDGPIHRGKADDVLWAMVAQHDILTRFSLQTTHILRLIEINEGADQEDDDYTRHTTHRSKKAASPLSQASSASESSSSVASTPRGPADAAILRTPRVSREKRFLVSQIHHISAELAQVDAQCKVHLADLTESLIEIADLIAKQMCVPFSSKDAAKSRISAREYTERLVQHLLEPIGQRMMAEPSAFSVDLFPRILDQCITVIIDNFARSSGKRNELQAAPFEAGVMYLRTWSFKLEMEYNALMRSLSSSSNNTDSSTETDSSDHTPLAPAYPANKRLELMTLGGFKRLETTLNSWLHASSTTGTAPDLGSGTSSRSWGVSSLAGGIRSTLVRTFSGRTTFSGPPV